MLKIRKIGFVGLGTVGKHMAANLARSDYELSVFDHDGEAVAGLVRLGAKAEPSALEAAGKKDLVIVILSELEAETVVFGEEGVLRGIDHGTVLVDMGTHSLGAVRRL